MYRECSAGIYYSADHRWQEAWEFCGWTKDCMALIQSPHQTDFTFTREQTAAPIFRTVSHYIDTQIHLGPFVWVQHWLRPSPFWLIVTSLSVPFLPPADGMLTRQPTILSWWPICNCGQRMRCVFGFQSLYYQLPSSCQTESEKSRPAPLKLPLLTSLDPSPWKDPFTLDSRTAGGEGT